MGALRGLPLELLLLLWPFLQAGCIKVLFVSPERLANPHLLEALRPHMPLPLV